MLFGIPRSARWLVTQYRIPEARQVLEKLGSDDPQGELDEIVASVHVEDAPHSEPLFQRKYWLPIYLAFTVAAFNQLAGINAILYYLNYIFAMAGFSKVLRPSLSMSDMPNSVASRFIAPTATA